MRIVNRFAFNADIRDREWLLGCGIPVGKGFSFFQIDEASPEFPAVLEWAEGRRSPPVRLVWTEFSRDEILAAPWLKMSSDWNFGYPQPEEAYRDIVYGPQGYCSECGRMFGQIAPFRIRRAPRRARKRVFQLHWVYGEFFFVGRELWEDLLRPLGIESLPVMNRKQEEIDDVVQLVVREEVALLPDRLELEETCGVCGVPKFRPPTRGPFPGLVIEPAAPLARTAQFFGSGGLAFRPLVVSNAVARVLIDNGVRALNFQPTEGEPVVSIDEPALASGKDG